MQIARRHGRDPAKLRAHAVSALRRHAGHGVHHGSTSQAQADVILARQLRTLDCWLNSPHPKFDSRHPFGDPHGGHGPHRRGSRIGVRNPRPARGCRKGLYSEP